MIFRELAKMFLVGFAALAAIIAMFTMIFLLADVLGNVVYWVVAVVFFSLFLGFMILGARG